MGIMYQPGSMRTIPGEEILEEYPFELTTFMNAPPHDLQVADEEILNRSKTPPERYNIKQGSYILVRDPRALLPGESYIIEKDGGWEILEESMMTTETIYCDGPPKTNFGEEHSFKKPLPVLKKQTKKNKINSIIKPTKQRLFIENERGPWRFVPESETKNEIAIRENEKQIKDLSESSTEETKKEKEREPEGPAPKRRAAKGKITKKGLSKAENKISNNGEHDALQTSNKPPTEETKEIKGRKSEGSSPRRKAAKGKIPKRSRSKAEHDALQTANEPLPEETKRIKGSEPEESSTKRKATNGKIPIRSRSKAENKISNQHDALQTSNAPPTEETKEIKGRKSEGSSPRKKAAKAKIPKRSRTKAENKISNNGEHVALQTANEPLPEETERIEESKPEGSFTNRKASKRKATKGKIPIRSRSKAENKISKQHDVLQTSNKPPKEKHSSPKDTNKEKGRISERSAPESGAANQIETINPEIYDVPIPMTPSRKARRRTLYSPKSFEASSDCTKLFGANLQSI